MKPDHFKPECPFCSKAEDDFFLKNDGFGAICSTSPILPGHSLVIPRNHYESIFELTENELSDLMYMGRNTARLLSALLGTTSFNFFVQEKKPAGQSIPHLHLHIVPRINGDFNKPGDWYGEILKSSVENKELQLPQDQLLDITQRLKNKANELKMQ